VVYLPVVLAATPAGGPFTEPTGSQRLVLSVSLLKSSSKSASMYWHWFE
jgi:hypothetical protein